MKWELKLFDVFITYIYKQLKSFSDKNHVGEEERDTAQRRPHCQPGFPHTDPGHQATVMQRRRCTLCVRWARCRLDDLVTRTSDTRREQLQAAPNRHLPETQNSAPGVFTIIFCKGIFRSHGNNQ